MNDFYYCLYFLPPRIHVGDSYLCLSQLKDGKLKDSDTVKIKLSGDGARMTRVTNFILFSFTILQSVDDVLSSKGKLYLS